MGDIIFKEESFQVMGACFEVYKEKGNGFLEQVYQESLEIELGLRRIPFVAKQELALAYKGYPLRSKYVPDLILYGKILVELKAVNALLNEHRAQLHNYLKATSHRLGILINFGNHPKLEYERIVL